MQCNWFRERESIQKIQYYTKWSKNTAFKNDVLLIFLLYWMWCNKAKTSLRLLIKTATRKSNEKVPYLFLPVAITLCVVFWYSPLIFNKIFHKFLPLFPKLFFCCAIIVRSLLALFICEIRNSSNNNISGVEHTHSSKVFLLLCLNRTTGQVRLLFVVVVDVIWVEWRF